MSKQLEKAREHFGEYFPKLLNIESPSAPISGAQLDDIIDKIEDFMRINGKDITTSQLRNVFDKVKNVPSDSIPDLKKLRPKIAYITARQQKSQAKTITELIGYLIKKVDNNPKIGKYQVKSLQTVLEAMVAYHKLHHSKTK